MVRKLVLHPVCILTCILMPLFLFLFFSENRYNLQPSWVQFLMNYLWAFISYGVFYYYMGRPIHSLVSRNVPFTFGCCLIFAFLTIAEAGTAALFFENYQQPSFFLWHVFSTLVVFIVAVVICSLRLEDYLRNIFGYDSKKVPFWWPLNRDSNLLQALLPKKQRGKILKLQSANQYVEVTTDKGSHDLRVTLKSLLESVPKNEGIHLHRSIWLHRDQIREFGYENGNPRVIDVHGEIIPVSRSKVDLVKKLLSNTQ